MRRLLKRRLVSGLQSFRHPVCFSIEVRNGRRARHRQRELIPWVHLARARADGKESDRKAEAFQVSRGLPASASDSSLSYAKELNHV
jgi:hypothetical protein